MQVTMLRSSFTFLRDRKIELKEESSKEGRRRWKFDTRSSTLSSFIVRLRHALANEKEREEKCLKKLNESSSQLKI
ncbi:CLUMA_CG003142, isoform A [Clunio marinus]|uniref:CLUMA_CG003142, isoform A n=1 Tax=Clunio marinus TaxID=568069 RepID=A0A1J1HPR5_9DIPT|nr:CLUMA_CG003142, isoform A [Clunio marinus]